MNLSNLGIQDDKGNKIVFRMLSIPGIFRLTACFLTFEYNLSQCSPQFRAPHLLSHRDAEL